MTWNELSNFTWDEARNFTWGDLKLDVNELLAKVEDNNIDVPRDIALKLKGLCAELNVSDSGTNNSTTSSKMSMADALKIISALIGIVNQLPDLYEKYKPHIISVYQELKQLINK